MQNAPMLTLPQSARDALALNYGGQFMDITHLCEANPFIRDMKEVEIGIAFAVHLTGCPNKTDQLLGLESGASASILRSPYVQKLIKVLVRGDVAVQGVTAAFKTLMDVMNDTAQGAAARTKAASEMLKWSGELDKESDERKAQELHSLSTDALISLLNQMVTQREAIEHKT